MAGIDPIYASEVDAINLLLKDSVRLTVSTRRLTDAEKAGLEEKKFFPKEFKVASDAIATLNSFGKNFFSSRIPIRSFH